MGLSAHPASVLLLIREDLGEPCSHHVCCLQQSLFTVTGILSPRFHIVVLIWKGKGKGSRELYSLTVHMDLVTTVILLQD